MSDYETTERPIEPAFVDEDAEQWVAVLAWEESRADYFEIKYKQLEQQLKQQWVSVDDELPDTSGFVIARSIGVVDDKHKTGTLILYYSDAYPKSERFQSQNVASHVTVTHWMPLPKPPTK